MPKYSIYGVVIGTKYIGEFEADSKEEAEEMAWEHDNASVSLCHHCAGKEIDEPEIDRLVVEESEVE
ncbi:hypothetical protein NCCP2716_27580 [Sporosarcina sp. NCCP-2716]|uniref:hypothetical protein n=1 Tax=Sporosarcina sp. NCCP-2716 TaxID=2943679 RepID=UPI0020426C24|nr:hypothetical protein [Sporosarcina sp. NCCP-2716]GKV69839.1 hypothetical protein NCCP2716_23370 [Sporosarcina sp. NCCP-2716]GKV70260.1 hypothetical protein NCCP2716_27580 [Sporosarcina sp. NCCP-2716]